MSTSETTMYDWDAIAWHKLERCVFKLQKRIYRASSRGDVKTVHKLQRLLTKSKAAALVAAKRVAQTNQGKKTAGIDGIASLTSRQKLKLAEEVARNPLPAKAKPVRRVWIPKPGKDEMRGLGIPVMADRARQALAKLALEPEWEAKFEPNSYGFRPGRSCHDAIEEIWVSILKAEKYVLDADIAKCFDRINHAALLAKLGTYPAMRRAVRAWLRAGIMDGGELFPTTEGTPQGGVISPLLANIALHGLETAVRAAFPHFKPPRSSKPNVPWKPKVIRYADDFVILHRDRDELLKAKAIAEEWLKGMGLEMKPSKTRITHTLKEIDGPAGFDFLGFNIRQYPRGKTRCTTNGLGEATGFAPSIRPSPQSQERLLQKVRDLLRSNQATRQATLVAKLSPILKGWGNYFSTVVSKEVFRKMDNLLFWKLWPWTVRRHPNKNRKWVADRYWVRDGHGWTFGKKGVAVLPKLAAIPIRRYVKVQGIRTPFDGDAIYWSIRTGKHPELPWGYPKLLKAQKGRCPVCGLHFIPGDSMQPLGLSRRPAVLPGRTALVHQHCTDVASHAWCE